MKLLIMRYCWICIFLFAPSSIKGQSAREADSLFLAGDYLGARVGYERLLFLGKSEPATALLKKSYCLKVEGKFEDAYNTLLRAEASPTSDSTKILIYKEEAVDSYLAGKYDITLSKLAELQYYYPNEKAAMTDGLQILSLNQLGRWSEASAQFNSFVATYVTEDKDLYQASNPPTLKNPDKAENLSYFLPGLGQVYAGYPLKGLASFVINAGIITFVVYSFAHGYYMSGAFTGVVAFNFTYAGGIGYAKSLALKHNSQQLAKFNKKLMDTVSEAIQKEGKK